MCRLSDQSISIPCWILRWLSFCSPEEIKSDGRGLNCLINNAAFDSTTALEGGDVETDIAGVSGYCHGGTRHDVTLSSPKFVELAGSERIVVNSYHDQGVTTSGLAPGLVPFALSDGAVVEGFHHPIEAIVGIQWHPERAGAPDDFDRVMIGAFLSRGAFWTQSQLERTCKP